MGTGHSTNQPALIQAEDLRFTYAGSEVPALDGIDLRANEGDFLLVTGESGSGKTTLAKIMAGILGPEDGEMSGSIRVGSEDMTGINSPVVGLVQQDPESQVVTLKVEDEVAFGPENLRLDRKEIGHMVQWALEAVNADHLAGRWVSTLSGGELQKIAIASILALRPRVLILDEPSSSLDPRSAFQLAGVLGDLNRRGMTIIVVEHHYSWIIQKVREVISISEGRLERAEIPAGRLEKGFPVETKPSIGTGQINLSMDNVSFDYGGNEALREISLDLRRGEILGLMGDNGSGKSTIFMIIMGFIKPSGGSISLEGKPLNIPSKVSERVGMVFQNPNHQILESTVRNELLFGPRNFGTETEVGERRVDVMLDEIGLSRYRDENPHKLSLGEKRRVNVGSVAIYNPTIYLLDEPFVGQDPVNTSRIMKIIRERVDYGSSCIVATHDPDFALRNCSRIAFLRKGALAHIGTPREVFTCLAEDGEEWYLPRLG